jgi:hypothetical protein
MKSALTITILVGVLGLRDLATAGKLETSPERAMDRYERAGPYVLDARVRMTPDANLIEASIRDFVWRHWQYHRLGFLTVVTVSIEGLPNRSVYFIEPDWQGRWSISLQSTEKLLARPGSDEQPEEVETSVIYSVQRVEPSPDGVPSRKVIAGKEQRDAASYRLVLKDKQGKIIRYL